LTDPRDGHVTDIITPSGDWEREKARHAAFEQFRGHQSAGENLIVRWPSGRTFKAWLDDAPIVRMTSSVLPAVVQSRSQAAPLLDSDGSGYDGRQARPGSPGCRAGSHSLST